MEQLDEMVRKGGEELGSLPQAEWDAEMRTAHMAEARTSSFSNNERLERLLAYKSEVSLGNELFTFFWATKSPFSQWHKCQFTGSFIKVAEPLNKEDNDEHTFSSAEQYMMYAKAMLFYDRETAQKILATNDVNKIKNLGRQVKHFDEMSWDFNKTSIVYEGNKLKFSQNEQLKESLLTTKGTTLVEAAPNDCVWGIGLAEDDPRAQKREAWLGQNLLGEILTQIRFELQNGTY